MIIWWWFDAFRCQVLEGQNEITFSLNATGNRVTRSHNKLAFITDLSITNSEGEVLNWILVRWYQKERFSPNANPCSISQPNTAWVQSDYVEVFIQMGCT